MLFQSWHVLLRALCLSVKVCLPIRRLCSLHYMLQCRLHLCWRGFLVGRVTGLWHRQQQRHMFTLKLEGVMPLPPKIPSHHPPPYPLATILGGMTCLSSSVTSVLLKFQELAGTLTIQDNKPAQQQPQNNAEANNFKCRSSHESEHDFMKSGHAF